MAMRTEAEIRECLAYWQGNLAASQIGEAVNYPEFLLKLSHNLQAYALEVMRLPPDFRHHVAKIQEKSIGVTIGTLRWVLGED